MIVGIGTDITSVARIRKALERHGERFAEYILTEPELEQFHNLNDPARFLAKRFAAKEAFGKAFGTGIRPPATFKNMGVVNNDLGKPSFELYGELAQHFVQRQWRHHLSISDEKEYALAYVIIESIN